MNEQTRDSLVGWMKFVGIITMISGILSAIGGVFFFIIGAAPGVLTAIAGFKVLDAAKNAENNDVASFMENMRVYFLMLGILIILSLASMFFVFLGAVGGCMAML